MFAICWIAYIQWETTIASFTQELNISMSQYSILWTVNGIMILVAQPLIRPAIILLKEFKISNVSWYFNFYAVFLCN